LKGVNKVETVETIFASDSVVYNNNKTNKNEQPRITANRLF